MKLSLSSLSTWIQAHRFLTLSVLVLVVGGIIFGVLAGNTQTTYEYVTARAGTFTQSVEGSGTVSTEASVDLAAQMARPVARVLVTPGDRVAAGETLVVLDNASEAAEVARARAAYEKAQRGSAASDIEPKQIAVDNARRALYSSDLVAISDTESVKSTAPVISGSFNGKTSGVYRISINYLGDRFYVSGLETMWGDISSKDTLPVPFGTGGLRISFPDKAPYPSNVTWTVTIPNKDGKNYTANKNAYDAAVAALEQVQAPSRSEDIAAAKASLESALAAYDKTVITAPFAGEVGKVPVTRGEYVNPGTILASVVANKKTAEITLNEVDVTGVVVGQPATLTFDAIPNLTLQGTVGQIDTVGTNDSGVITFGVKIVFSDDDPRVRPGMNVTAVITTLHKENAFLVPTSVVKKDSARSYVRVKNPDSPTDRPTFSDVTVTTGLANDIDTEILSGITEKDQMVYRTVTAVVKKAQGLLRPPDTGQ